MTLISLRTVSTLAELTSSDLRGILLAVEGINPGGPAKVDALATRNFSNLGGLPDVRKTLDVSRARTGSHRVPVPLGQFKRSEPAARKGRSHAVWVA